MLILDETDRMLDMGFGVQLDAIIEHMPHERQTLMFSATVPAEIERLSKKAGLSKPTPNGRAFAPVAFGTTAWAGYRPYPKPGISLEDRRPGEP